MNKKFLTVVIICIVSIFMLGCSKTKDEGHSEYGKITSKELYLPKNGTLSKPESYSLLVKITYESGEVTYETPTDISQVGDVVTIDGDNIIATKSGSGNVIAYYKGEKLIKEVLVTDPEELKDRLNKVLESDNNDNRVIPIKLQGLWVDGGIKVFWNEDLPIVDFYEVYRSENDGEFKKIQKIKGGTVDSDNMIEFYDVETNLDSVYTYRLEVTKVDGVKETLSDLVMKK